MIFLKIIISQQFYCHYFIDGGTKGSENLADLSEDHMLQSDGARCPAKGCLILKPGPFQIISTHIHLKMAMWAICENRVMLNLNVP